MIERVEVFYSGRVQGVGFRWMATDKARGLPIDGTVKNLPDGRVHLVAEGERNDLLELLERITLQMGGSIHDQKVEWLLPLKDLQGFKTIF